MSQSPKKPADPSARTKSGDGKAAVSPGGGGARLSVTLLVVGLVAVIALAAVSLGSGSSGSGSPGPGDDQVAADQGAEAEGGQGQPDEELLALARREADDPFARGDRDAPVVMIEYSDFQCPFCGKFARSTKPDLVREYVEKGVLRIEWRQFPIFGEESERAARASYAAGQQGRFWEFHDVAFGKERRKNSGAFAQDAVEAMADKAGVPDLKRFAEDMHGEDATTALSEDTDEGYALGVSSTPAFLVNGTPVLGAQSIEYFTATIERAKARAERAEKAD